MMDDIGNFFGPPPKGKEDIRNHRPSFIWAVVAEIANSAEYESFIQATDALPNESAIHSWAEHFNLKNEAKSRASKYLWNSLSDQNIEPDLLDQFEDLFIKLENSYV